MQAILWCPLVELFLGGVAKLKKLQDEGFMCSSISLGRSISSVEKSLSRAGIFAQDWLFFGSRSSGIHQNVSSIRAIITLEFNLQHTQDKLALMTKEGDSGDLRLVLQDSEDLNMTTS